MLSKFSNFSDELSENHELREYELSGSDCNGATSTLIHTLDTLSVGFKVRVDSLSPVRILSYYFFFTLFICLNAQSLTFTLI